MFGKQHFEKTAVGVEATRIKDGVFGAEKAGEFLFELLVECLGATDEAHRGHPKAPALQSGASGGDDFRVIGQPEVIVSAKVDHVAAVVKADAGILAGIDEPLSLVKTGGGDFIQCGMERGKEGFREHGGRRIHTERHVGNLIASEAAPKTQDPRPKTQDPRPKTQGLDAIATATDLSRKRVGEDIDETCVKRKFHKSQICSRLGRNLVAESAGLG